MLLWVAWFIWISCIEKPGGYKFLIFQKIYKSPHIWGLRLRFLQGIVISFSVLPFGSTCIICSCEYFLQIYWVVFLPNGKLLTILYSGHFSGVWTGLSRAIINEVYATAILGWYRSTIAMFYMTANLWIKMRNYSYLARYLEISRQLYSFMQSTRLLGYKNSNLRLLT